MIETDLLDLQKPSALAFDAEKFARSEHAQAVDSLPEQVAEVAPVEREQYVGARKRGEKDGFVLGCLEDNRPVEGQFVVLNRGLAAERDPCAHGLGQFVGEIVAHFAQHPR